MPNRKKPSSTKRSTAKAKAPVRLSIACGNRKPEGFIGVDFVKTKDTDYVMDLLKFPWKKFANNSVDEIECSHFIEHIPHGDGFKDPFFQFFDEIYRILKPAEFDPNNPNIALRGFARIKAPYYASMRAWQDPSHLRAITETTFLYLNRQWRIDNLLNHYPIKCDFDFSYGYIMAPEWQNRSQETQTFAIQHYFNVVQDLEVLLTKRG